jgi:hypothetical protein
MLAISVCETWKAHGDNTSWKAHITEVHMPNSIVINSITCISFIGAYAAISNTANITSADIQRM